jgi:hypothetical protein
MKGGPGHRAAFFHASRRYARYRLAATGTGKPHCACDTVHSARGRLGMLRIAAAGLLLLTGCSIPLEGSDAGRARPEIGTDARGPETRASPFSGRTLQPGDATAPGGTGGLSDSGIPGGSDSGTGR